MSGTLNTDGLLRLEERFRSLSHLDFSPLMTVWGKILVEDNRAGALAGLDGDGNPLIPVTYRPDPKAGAKKPVVYTILRNNNLTSGHYRTLSGPPLAPRREQSRIVTNFRADQLREGGNWAARGMWEDVFSVRDVPFLKFHFRGEGRLPVRNLARVRPSAKAKAIDALRQFCTAALRGGGTSAP